VGYYTLSRLIALSSTPSFSVGKEVHIVDSLSSLELEAPKLFYNF